MLQFTAKTLAGADFAGAGLAGKAALLWFWSPSSMTCAEQAVGVRRVATGYAGKINVIGIAVDGDAAAQRQFIDKWELDKVTHLSGADGAVAKRFMTTGAGIYVMIDSAGELKDVGTLNNDRLLSRIDRLVGPIPVG
ncbi:TlpA family protein disulfide reductase [Dactylosporangium siamense]|uniref:Thioredoxin domain-containing protein n=1 Tax=Dactylosporangium siamense TaxID=685454 RepID=A0A919PUD5_9ACTN|nr:redoxin family protein [Dactylosporangium siamense]GIG49892.1 hypothetical protein Dsi01nite_079330 [Dactylosporangium siamense]